MAGLASLGTAWGSASSVSAFAAIKSVGFDPVGQVFGAAAYPLTATAAVSCPGTAASYSRPDASPTGRIYQGYRTAIDRMTSECSELGGHGVVGVVLQLTENPGDSVTVATAEFKVMGTAVRAQGCPMTGRPFTAELSGADFAKLILAGWVPTGIALGIYVTGLHDDMLTTGSGPWGSGSAEVPAYTDLMVGARNSARSHLEQAVRDLGADGVVVSAMTLRVSSDACQAHPGGTDHFAEAVITGTAVARFAELSVAGRVIAGRGLRRHRPDHTPGSSPSGRR